MRLKNPVSPNIVIGLYKYQPSVYGTVLIILGSFLITAVPSGTAYEVAHQAALIMGTIISIVCWLEFHNSPRNIIRVDLLMIVALYGLTLLEFLFPQPKFNLLVRVADVKSVMVLIAIGFTGIATGRHWHFRHRGQSGSHFIYLSPLTLFLILLLFAFVGYLHMLWAVNFNPVALVDAMVGPRFSEPWGRERFGGFKDLFYELGLLIYLVPAIAGVILARRPVFSRNQVLVTRLIYFFTLFYGFTSGTRNVFAVYIITYMCAYIMVQPDISRAKVMRMGMIYGIILLVSVQFILEFRREGLAHYVQRTVFQDQHYQKPEKDRAGLVIDNNLLSLARTVDYFPKHADYLGFEVPYWALVKPIPRAFWSGKPKGLSVSIETVRNEKGAAAATWASTFLGESYMGGGLFGVGVAALFFGILAAWWNKRFIPTADLYQNLLYASGIFAALISMRSIFWLTTAILPAIALIVYAQWFLRRQRNMLMAGAGTRVQHPG